jgi:single-stranded-DNA-specific exonuclease
MWAETAAASSSATANEEGATAFGVSSSLSGRAWRFRPSERSIEEALQLQDLSPQLSRILAARGVTAETLSDFLEPRLKTLLPDPYVMRDMERAATRIADAIMRNEKIAVLGDYDVDGACASALLLRYLSTLQRPALLHIPDRMTEGYGPSVYAMEKLSAEGAKLVVTVDCGASATEALNRASALGLDVVVLDHHAVPVHPPSYAHVNANAPGDSSGLTQLCAAGVTFVALVALTRVLRDSGWFEANKLPVPDLLQEIDLVGLSTITDVVPLTGVNRAFVKQGLRRLGHLERKGFAALAQVAKIEPPFTPYHLGFIFGPRINAGGRVGRCDLGARLLSTASAEDAASIAAELDLHNRERQAIEQMILERATEMGALRESDSFLFLHGDNWHPGVVGIVASRLKDRFEKPVLVAGFMSAQDTLARGSARSVAGVDLGAVVRGAKADGILESGGGHAMAAGFGITRERIADFEAYLRSAFDPQRQTIAAARVLDVDAAISPGAASLLFLDELDRASPFGPGNPEPVFVIPDATVAYADVVGINHLKLRLAGTGGQMLDAIAFRIADTPLGQGLLKARGRRIHAAGKLRRDSYNNRERVQLYLEDAALAGV